jgi:hypothetical protein
MKMNGSRYHQFDTHDSEMYIRALATHHDLKNKHEQHRSKTTAAENDHLFNFKDISLVRLNQHKDATIEHNLWTDQYNTNKYKVNCAYKIYDEMNQGKNYSDCLGYECNRNHPHDFMYLLDEYNTYHNYPVCTMDPNIQTINCCPKNVQIFNNLTRRHYAHPQPARTPVTLFIEDDKIPMATMNSCSVVYP